MSLLEALGNVVEASGIERQALPTVIPAMIAAGVLVAFADGTADSEELRTIDQNALRQALRHPDAGDDVRMILHRHADNFDRGLEYGRAHALAVLADWSPASGAEKDVVMRAALAVGRAGGELSQSERATMIEIARALGLDPGAHCPS